MISVSLLKGNLLRRSNSSARIVFGIYSTIFAPFLSQVENFFCMGSPLAVFLALRGIRPGTSCHQDHILPTAICSRLFNVFHPTDPVVSPLLSLQMLQMLSLTRVMTAKSFCLFFLAHTHLGCDLLAGMFCFYWTCHFPLWTANRNQICNSLSQDVYIKNVQKFSH